MTIQNKNLPSDELYEALEQALSVFPKIRYGACPFPKDIDAGGEFKSIFIVIIPHEEMVSLEEFTEQGFRAVMYGTNPEAEKAGKAVESVLNSLGINWRYTPSTVDPELFETQMTELLNAKEAARKSGLGWIGKSNLLITREYGPRIRLLSFLIDAELPFGTPIERNFCGNCTRCKDACPCNAIKGIGWSPGIRREQQIDYETCSLSRLDGFRKIGRKFNCGMCITACPWGLKHR